LVAAATIPAGLTIALFAGDIIFAWTESTIAAQQAGQVASILVIAQLMQAITVIPCNLALAYGNVRLNLNIGIASIILTIPLCILLIAEYGIVGAGYSWLIMNICTFPPYMYFLHRRFLSGELRKWYLRDVVRPLLVALPCVLLGAWLVPHTSSRLLTFSLVGMIWLIATVATVIVSPELRLMVRDMAPRVWNVFIGIRRS
jgi:O-antigen/teichoic acid export membrane protein